MGRFCHIPGNLPLTFQALGERRVRNNLFHENLLCVHMVLPCGLLKASQPPPPSSSSPWRYDTSFFPSVLLCPAFPGKDGQNFSCADRGLVLFNFAPPLLEHHFIIWKTKTKLDQNSSHRTQHSLPSLQTLTCQGAHFCWAWACVRLHSLPQ